MATVISNVFKGREPASHSKSFNLNKNLLLFAIGLFVAALHFSSSWLLPSFIFNIIPLNPLVKSYLWMPLGQFKVICLFHLPCTLNLLSETCSLLFYYDPVWFHHLLHTVDDVWLLLLPLTTSSCPELLKEWLQVPRSLIEGLNLRTQFSVNFLPCLHPSDCCLACPNVFHTVVICF